MSDVFSASAKADSHRAADAAVVSGHTPGKWEVSEARGVDEDFIITGGEPGEQWGLVATAWTAADARLIAAAPDLAGTGAFLLDRLADFENRISTDEDAREFHGHVAPAIANFRAAITKANPLSDKLGGAGR